METNRSIKYLLESIFSNWIATG